MSYRQVLMRKILTGMRVDNLMSKNVVTVPAALTLDKLMDDYFFRYRFASFPVIEDDAILGLVTLHSVKEIERARWPQVTARETMVPISTEIVIDKQAEVTEALAKMAGSGIGRLLVIEDAKLIGILSQRDIVQLFELKSQIEEK